jgi:electron transport complex protein RnfC
VGTPVSHVLSQLGVEIEQGDRIVFGGPMRGKSIYSLDTPIDWETDAILVQDKAEIIFCSDTHCINCGECVKVCPVNIPVNMLVRLLENGLFEEAKEEYGLLSCVECGLCSYVCIARIPVFHYIMLGKYELSKMGE